MTIATIALSVQDNWILRDQNGVEYRGFESYVAAERFALGASIME